MPKVSREHQDARRRQILDAAVDCFAREGFHRATMQDIVRRAGLSPGAIYGYFASKEEIVEAIADERHARERALLARIDAEADGSSGDVARALARLADDFVGALRDPGERAHRRVGVQLWAEALRNPRILRIVRRGVDEPRRRIAALVRRAQRRGELSGAIDPDAQARMVIAAFLGFVLQQAWDPGADVAAYLQALRHVGGALGGAGSERDRRVRKARARVADRDHRRRKERRS